MPIRSVLRIGLLAALASGAFIGQALAQQGVQITSEAINQVCAERYGTQNVQAEAPTVRGPESVTLNCRVTNANGPTIAQFTPGEVCQRLTGSTDWYRGDGTQVYCRAGATPAQPRSFTINADDIAKACQRTHRNPQATADPTTVGRNGVEFNCRLTNQNGVTLARVSPEEICESKFGTREYMNVLGSNTIVCKGTPTELAQPDGLPNKPPGGGAGGGGGGGGGAPSGAPNDIPLTAEALTRGCRALHGDSATSAPLTYPPAGFEVTINCNTAGGRATYDLAQFCPHVSGTGGWYITDFGRGTFLPGEVPGTAPRLHVCRGPGPLQYHAMADIGRYCKGKGHRYGNYGSTGMDSKTGAPTAPACWDAPGNRMVPTYIDMADVCRVVHGGSAYEARGWVYLCLPAGTQAQAGAAAPSPAQSCPGCGPLRESIARYEQQIKEEEKRLADEEAYRRKREGELTGLTRHQRERWQTIANASAVRIENAKKLIAQLKVSLADRIAQLNERQGRCPGPGCGAAATNARPDPAPVKQAAEQPCADCVRLTESIARYEQQIKVQEKRIADEEADKRKHEEGLKSRTGREREDWQNIVNASAARIASTKELLAIMKAVLEDRKAQLVERQTRPDLAPPAASTTTTPPSTAERSPPKPTFETVERPPSPPRPTFETVERPPPPPRPTFETIERPRSPPAPTTTERPPTVPPAPATDPGRASTTSASACPEHEAELTNGERVFHRLYVRGGTNTTDETKMWMETLNTLKTSLEKSGRQAPGSSTQFLPVPSAETFAGEIRRLQRIAKPCEEVTIFLSAHGEPTTLGPAGNLVKTEETQPEYVELFKGGGRLWDQQLGVMVKGFQPGVSVTVIVGACFGGGFAGPGNVEESKLVQLIGLFTLCTPWFDEAVAKGVDDTIAKKQNSRVTARDVKAHMLRANWPLGQPFDNDTDTFLEEYLRLNERPKN